MSKCKCLLMCAECNISWIDETDNIISYLNDLSNRGCPICRNDIKKGTIYLIDILDEKH